MGRDSVPTMPTGEEAAEKQASAHDMPTMAPYDPEGKSYCSWGPDYLWVRIVLWNSTMEGGGVVIDSGATATVFGLEWLKTHAKTDGGFRLSRRSFKFGDEKIYQRLGETTASVEVPVWGKGKVGRKAMLFNTDVAPCAIPMLASRATLQEMNAMICFPTNQMYFPHDATVSLGKEWAGHVSIPFAPHSFSILTSLKTHPTTNDDA